MSQNYKTFRNINLALIKTTKGNLIVFPLSHLIIICFLSTQTLVRGKWEKNKKCSRLAGKIK